MAWNLIIVTVINFCTLTSDFKMTSRQQYIFAFIDTAQTVVNLYDVQKYRNKQGVI